MARIAGINIPDQKTHCNRSNNAIYGIGKTVQKPSVLQRVLLKM